MDLAVREGLSDRVGKVEALDALREIDRPHGGGHGRTLSSRNGTPSDPTGPPRQQTTSPAWRSTFARAGRIP